MKKGMFVNKLFISQKKLIYSILLFAVSLVLLIALSLGWFLQIRYNNVEAILLHASATTFDFYQSTDTNKDGIPDEDENSNIIYIPEDSERVVISNIYPMYTIAFKADVSTGSRGGYLTVAFDGLCAPDAQNPTPAPTTLPPTSTPTTSATQVPNSPTPELSTPSPESPAPTPSGLPSPTPDSPTPTPSGSPTPTPDSPTPTPGSPTPTPNIPSPTPIVDVANVLRIKYTDPNSSTLIDKPLSELMDENRNIVLFSDYHITGNGDFSFSYMIYMDGTAGNEYQNKNMVIDRVVFYVTQ